jgi:ATP-binding protein involved in chromosome partitioning
VAANAGLTGAIVVVTPQDVAHLDAKKVIELWRRAEVPVLGGVENMSGLACPHCGERIDVFPPVAPDRSIWAMGVEPLASLPIDPAIAAAADAGRIPGAPFAALADAVAARLD